MASHPNHRTILFADVCGSTALYEKLGDEKAVDLIDKILSVMREVVAAKGGQVVKTIGDEIMTCFWHPVHAIDAAKAIFSRLSIAPPGPGLPMVAVHMGMTHGPVTQQAGDLFGDAVNTAARLTTLAKPWQLLTTEASVAPLGPESQEITRRVIRSPLRGKSGEMDILEVVWDNEEMTRSTMSIDQAAITGRLVLRLKEEAVEVSLKHPVATLGRVAHNDLVAGDKGVSRWHARVEMRRGKWFLVDMSTNGTYVHAPGRPPAFVKYEEYLLPDSGHLILGRESDPEHRVTVSFARA